jgi:dTMP kinase
VSARSGRLIALEGVDGCGKSTQAARLAVDLGAVLTHEPGATELGGRLRNLLLDPAGPPAVPRAELLLLAADRAQHVELIIGPALGAGRWVVTDRYSGSTFAYQGFGRGIGANDLASVLSFATGGLGADLSVLVDLDVLTARKRLGANAPDRLERLDDAFFERVRQGYLTQAAADPQHWVTVDGTGGVDEVAEAIGSAVADRLGHPDRPR